MLGAFFGMTKPGHVGERPFLRRDGLHFDAGVLPLHDARLPHDADAELLGLEPLRERLVGGIDACAGLLALEQQLLAGLELLTLPPAASAAHTSVY